MAQETPGPKVFQDNIHLALHSVLAILYVPRTDPCVLKLDIKMEK